MQLKPIKTQQDYEIALERLEKIFEAQLNTSEGDELEKLGMLIDKYEQEHYPIAST